MKTYSIQLPKGWKIESPFLISEDGCERFILAAGGEIDRNLIAITLENYGYREHAKRIFLTPAQIAADDLLIACKSLLQMMDTTKPRKLDQAITWRENDEMVRRLASEAIDKAERDPDDF